METITNVAAAASKTIFGDGSEKKEPVSGAAGDVSKGEPYDAGNLDAEEQKRFESNPATPGVAEKTNEDVKVTDDPTAAATTSTEPTPKGDTSAGQTDPKDKPTNTSDNPEEGHVDATGPGPKPVAVLAKEHGGDAGQASKTPAVTSDDSEGKKEGDDAGKDAKKEGSGEKVVHATGLAADGGDFDATKPGAAREAERLMEEKGIAHEGGGGGKGGGDSSSSGNGGKKKLTERIKAKLHLN